MGKVKAIIIYKSKKSKDKHDKEIHALIVNTQDVNKRKEELKNNWKIICIVYIKSSISVKNVETISE